MDIEARLRNMAARIEQLKPEDLEGKEELVASLEKNTAELEELYKRDSTEQ